MELLFIRQVGGKLRMGLEATLPSVEAEWKIRTAELESLRAKNDELRLKKEAERTREEQVI